MKKVNTEKHDKEISNKAYEEFADEMIVMMSGHKADILQILERLKSKTIEK